MSHVHSFYNQTEKLSVSLIMPFMPVGLKMLALLTKSPGSSAPLAHIS